MTDTKHIDRPWLTALEKSLEAKDKHGFVTVDAVDIKFALKELKEITTLQPSPTIVNQLSTTDSVEAWREKMYEWCERNCEPGEFHFGSLIQIVYDELISLQAHTSQQVEEAVLQADATGAYHSGYLAGKAEVEEAVRIDENTSDGYHTFRELYEFRLLYNAHLFNEWAKQGMYDVHKSQRHNDGELCFGRDDYFVVVATLPTGQISNHYPMTDWDLFQCEAVEKAKAQWDGHTSQDVAQRLRDALTPNHQD